MPPSHLPPPMRPNAELVTPDVVEAQSAWALALCEPLICYSTRRDLQRAMRRSVVRQPAWSLTRLAVLLSLSVETLPSADPWRDLSLTVDFSELPRSKQAGRVELRAGRTSPPPTTGATGPSGLVFGTLDDCLDIFTGTGLPGPTLDGTEVVTGDRTAVSTPLSGLSAAMLALGGQGAVTCRRVLGQTYGAMTSACRNEETRQVATQRFLNALEPALCWLLFRRRSYLDWTDAFWPQAVARSAYAADRWLLGTPFTLLPMAEPSWHVDAASPGKDDW